jgi:phasin family protein
MLPQEQVAATQKANVDLLSGLSSKAVEGLEKLAALNVQVMQAALADTFDLMQKSLLAKEPQEWLALQNSRSEQMAEKMQTYSRHAFNIALAMQAEFARVAQVRCGTYGRQMQTAVEDVAKNAPAGSEALSALNSAIAAANTLYETLQSAGQQAVEVTRSNLELAAAASKNARHATSPASQAR